MSKAYLYDLFLHCDLFGKEPKFLIKRKQSYQTVYGAIASILLISLIILFSAQFTIDLFFKQEPTLITTKYNDELPKKIDLSTPSFFMALSLQHQNYSSFIDESLYTISSELITITTDDQGKQFISKSIIDLIICSEASIQVIPEYFNQLDLKNLYCFKNRTGLNIEGDYGKSLWTYIAFTIKKCKNDTNSIITSKCQPETVINNRLSSGYFGFFMTDITIYPQNYTSPRHIFGKNDFTTFSWDIYRDVWLKLKSIQLETDYGLLLPEINTEEYFAMDSLSYIWDNRKSDTFLSFMIRTSPCREVYKRSYIKLQALAANIGGTAKFVMTIGEIILFFITNVFYKDFINTFFYEKTFTKSSAQHLHKTLSNANYTPPHIKLSNKLPKAAILRNCYLTSNHLNKSTDILNNSISKENSKNAQADSSYRGKTREEIKKRRRNDGHLMYLICCFMMHKQRKELMQILKKYRHNVLSFDFLYFLKGMNDLRLIKKKVLSNDEEKMMEIAYCYENWSKNEGDVYNKMISCYNHGGKYDKLPNDILKEYGKIYERIQNDDQCNTDFNLALFDSINLKQVY